MPVRNGAAHVAFAVQSVLDQTCREFELVALENHSEDTTGRILDAFAARDARVRVLRSDRTLPIDQSWDRIRALGERGELRGEFLTLMGHDDRLLPDFLATIAGLVEAHPDAAIWQTDFRIIDGQGALKRLSRPAPARETLEQFFLARCHEQRDSFGTGPVFRLRDYLAVGGIPLYPRLMYSDDMLWLKLMQRGDKVTAPAVAFEYRQHEGNTSSEQSAERYLATLGALRRFVDELERSFPQLLATDAQRDALQALLLPIFRHTEKGTYRVGIAAAQVLPDWQALAAHLERRGRVAPVLRYRPLKRALHTLRRALSPR